jgi:phage/plasmid-like protein (TIGR03299 family)
MAHLIENNMIAWRAEEPWHGLGVQVGDEYDGLPRDERVKAWLQAAGMDWKVQRRGLAMRDSDGAGLLVDPLSNYRAIVREDTNQVFQVATNRYHPLQNEQIVGFFQEYCEAGEARIETVGAISGGEKVWALAKLTNGDGRYDVGGDKANGYLLLASSHDGSLQTIGKTTMVYVVCYNTLSAALGIRRGKLGEKESGEFRFKHSRKFTSQVAKEAKEVMGIAIEQAQEVTEHARTLSKVQVDHAGRVEYLKRLLNGESILEQVVADSTPATTLDEIVAAQTREVNQEGELKRLGKAILECMTNSPGSDLVERKNTLWGAVNGVTYFVDHERGRTQDARLSQAWFGQGDRLKRDAVKVALEIAGK